MKTINAKEFKNLLKNNNSFQIIDIREPYEYEDGALTNENIPLDKMMSSINKIHKDRPVIIYCQSGKRASAIIYMLEKEYKLENLYNLEGGYNAIMQEEYESI
ncbi:MAG: NADH oxidase [Bacteroidetes bacterium MED-G21]|nr:MAG: NADH oxidase [Bacteroidetes bacterium MED-G21]